MSNARLDGQSDPRYPDRGNPTTGVHERHGVSTIAFVTVCTKGRERWLADELCHVALRSVWVCCRGWRIGRYVIMPDHVHFFASPGDQEVDVEPWVEYWKSMLRRALQERAGRWQSRCMHYRIRDGHQYEEKIDYMLENPVRAGLVSKPKDWEFQGEIYRLTWQDNRVVR